MTLRLRIDWSYAALAVLYDLHPYEAMVVDRAVVRYAERREGLVERVAPYYRLSVRGFRVLFNVDTVADTMNVLYLYRLR